MEKYLADRSYALIYRMCQVQAFSSRLHARGFPAIGKYEPKTPPRTAGVTKCVIGFSRYSGLARRFCREGPIRATQKPVARAFLAPGLRKAEPDSRTLRSLPGRISGSVARGAWYVSGRIIQCPGNCSPPGAFIGNRALRIVRMPNRPGIPAPVRPVGQPACTRAAASSIASGGILFR